MSGKDLFEGMSYVDERFVDEAESRAFPKSRVSPWIKAVSMAACLCLIMFCFRALPSVLEDTKSEGPMGQGTSNSIIEDSLNCPPDQAPEIEVPNVILYVEEMTEDGFVAAVTGYGETTRLGLGTKWNVTVAGGTRSEADGDSSMSDGAMEDFSGCYVLVQFFDYDADSGTIVADSVQIIQVED